jgi:hypothetical protein
MPVESDNGGTHMYRSSWAGIIYLIIGLLVANSHGYFADIGTLSGILSALLAIALWPLLLFGANLHIAL